MSLLDWQISFAGRLRGEAAMSGPLGVYQRNVQVSLAEVLAKAFPATRHALGALRFDPLAAAFVRQRPPAAAALWLYGEGFPDSLDDPPWASDLARLDLASHRALFAADPPPLDPRDLAAVGADALDGLRLVLHPSLTIVESPWSLALAWRAWREDRAVPPLTPGGDPLAILVARVDNEVVHRPLADRQARLYRGWMAGTGLAAMAECEGPGPIQEELTFLLRHQLCVGLIRGDKA